MLDLSYWFKTKVGQTNKRKGGAKTNGQKPWFSVGKPMPDTDNSKEQPKIVDFSENYFK